jgi:hypothetical protein
MFFYAGDGVEPPHVHVERESKEAKFWLEPVRLAFNRGFGASELIKISRLVEEHHDIILKAWYDYFGRNENDD